MDMRVERLAVEERSPRHPGWRVVAACFVMAVFAWGFAFYGNGVYLAELRRAHGWSLSLIGGATTCFYLTSALLVVFVSDAVRRIGPRVMVVGGALLLAAAVLFMGRVQSPWQLYLAYLLMAAAWAAMSGAAINNVLGLWFETRRGLAVSLALNGASAGGFLAVPVLVAAVGAIGFADAMLAGAITIALVLAPLLWFSISAPPERRPAPDADLAKAAAPRQWTRARALKSLKFWSFTAAFAAALLAQVGFLVHQIPFLEPGMGRGQAGLAVALTSLMAMLGRLALGVVAHRTDQRLVSALSFLSQAGAIIAMVLWSDTSVRLVACAVFGLSVGNVITLPALIVDREFEAPAFGMLVGLASAITQVVCAIGPWAVGALRDFTGTYTAPLIGCAALQILATGLVLCRATGKGVSMREPT